VIRATIGVLATCVIVLITGTVPRAEAQTRDEAAAAAAAFQALRQQIAPAPSVLIFRPSHSLSVATAKAAGVSAIHADSTIPCPTTEGPAPCSVADSVISIGLYSARQRDGVATVHAWTTQHGGVNATVVTWWVITLKQRGSAWRVVKVEPVAHS
jgi:hypothetical protein